MLKPNDLVVYNDMPTTIFSITEIVLEDSGYYCKATYLSRSPISYGQQVKSKLRITSRLRLAKDLDIQTILSEELKKELVKNYAETI